MRPAPTSSTIDIASSVTTSACRVRPVAVPALAPRVPPSFNVSVSDGRDSCNAGTAPNTRPVISVVPIVIRTIVRSTSNVIQYGTVVGIMRVMNSSIVHVPSRSPSVPPATASRKLSVRNCRTMRSREAPIASRTATSRCRAEPRASSRLATLAQAISNTKPTAPSIVRKTGRTSRAMRSFMGTTHADWLRLVSPCRCSSPRMKVDRRASACSTLTPGASRADTW
jgi:hypothetical protein